MPRIIRNNDQTLADVAVQHLGDIEALVPMCVNADISLTDTGIAHINVDMEVVDKKVVEQLNKVENIPASGLEEAIPQGVGYWAVGLDFKVS